MAIRPEVKELIYIAITFFTLLFVATNVNTALGTIYLMFVLGGLGFLTVARTFFNVGTNIPFQKQPGGAIKAFGWGILAWGILLVVSSFLMKWIDPTQASLGAIITILGATTPALASSKIANFLTFGFVIPFAETQLWARLMEFIADVFHIDISKQSYKKISTIVLIVLLSAGFMVFHITAKGITSTASLAVVFVMMVISLIMVTIFQETRQAVDFHIVANSVASYLLLFATGI